MSFGPSANEKSAISNQQGIGNTAVQNAGAATASGSNLLNVGGANVASGTNFFNTLLNGNRANTASMLQPNIDQIRQANQQGVQAASTLMPRGGGRSGALFSSMTSPNAQISSLFGQARSQAAPTLANIGLQQQGQGTNLFGIGNQALGVGTNANQNVFSDSFNNRQYSNNMWSQLGSGLFNLATMPMGGFGDTLAGKIGKGIGGLFNGGG